MKKWHIADKENIADIKLEVFGKNKLTLLQNLTQAFSSLICDFKKLKNKIKIGPLKIKEENFKDSLFKFTEKLIFLKDTQFFLPKKGDFQIKNNQIISYLYGQKINKNLPIKIDIKAVTYHKFNLIKKNDSYTLTLVFDI
jgi:SHS2 domain-containing protein